jgi:hypothetical protein
MKAAMNVLYGEEEPSLEQLRAVEHFVPEHVRPHWYRIMHSFPTSKDFANHPDWKLHAKSATNKAKIFLRMSDNQLLCVKSTAHIREDFDVILENIINFDMKV